MQKRLKSETANPGGDSGISPEVRRRFSPDELRELAAAIADSRSITELAAAAGSDRGTMATWLRRADFMRAMAAAFVPCPFEIGAERLRRMRCDDAHGGEHWATARERAAAWGERWTSARLQMALWEEIRAQFDGWLFGRPPEVQAVVDADVWNHETAFTAWGRGEACDLFGPYHRARAAIPDDAYSMTAEAARDADRLSSRPRAVQLRGAWAEFDRDATWARRAWGRYFNDPLRAPRDSRLPMREDRARALWDRVVRDGEPLAAAVRRI